jgi:signal transduction histidine kinase
VLRGIGRFLRGIGLGLRGIGIGLLAIGRGLFAVVRAIGRGVRAAARGLRRVSRGHPVADWVAWFVAVVLSFISFGTGGVMYDVDSLGWGLMPFVGALIGLPFGLVVRRPLLGWGVSIGSAVAMSVLMPVQAEAGIPWPWHIVQGLVMLALLFAVCVTERTRVALVAWVTTTVLWVGATPSEQSAAWGVAVTTVALFGWLAGRLARTRTALRRQTELSEEERARRVRLQERARIARDLHDIVAHHMSLIVVQAETAPFRVPGLSDPARAELTSIGEAARAALTETRALLTVLRQEEDAPQDAPQPGVEQIEDLCAAARRAGAVVDAAVEPIGDRLRPGTALAAYRIVQEALSNASRHAPGARVRVVVGVEPWPDGERCTVAVTNTRAPGALPGGGVSAAAGHGITGMSERAAAEGGTLTAGRTPDGGFAVVATLPLADAAVSVVQPPAEPEPVRGRRG